MMHPSNGTTLDDVADNTIQVRESGHLKRWCNEFWDGVLFQKAHIWIIMGILSTLLSPGEIWRATKAAHQQGNEVSLVGMKTLLLVSQFIHEIAPDSENHVHKISELQTTLSRKST